MSETTCNFCNREPSTKGDHCLPCHAVILAMGVIRRNWGTTEYTELGGKLRAESFIGFKRSALANSAPIAANLGDMLFRLCSLSGVGEDAFKSRLFSAMNHDRLEMEGHEKSPGGIEGWRDRVGRNMAEAAGVLIQKAKQESLAARMGRASRYAEDNAARQ